MFRLKGRKRRLEVAMSLDFRIGHLEAPDHVEALYVNDAGVLYDINRTSA